MSATTIPMLYNPAARHGSAARRIGAVQQGFAERGIDVRLIASNAAGDIEARARELSESGTRRLLLAGGDGSLHEAVNGVLASSTPAAIGLIPLGTGNDFAKANHIPAVPDAAVDALASRLAANTSPREVDVGRCNTRFFANGAGIGFDAKISRIASDMKLPIGILVYPLAVIRGLIDGVLTPRMTLRFDGQVVDAQLTLASFSIGQWVGGMFHIAPMAKTDDGYLDLVHVDALRRREIVRLVPKLLQGTHLEDARVHHALIQECRIQADAEVPAHLDGENQPLQRSFEISILPGALRLL